MYIDYTPQQRALKQQLRAYFAEMMTPALQDELAETEGGGPLYHAAMQKMGADGWLGIGWPREVGGQGRPAIDEFIFYDEAQRALFPIPFLTLCTVGPTLYRYGTPEQKEKYVKPILQGKMHFSIGYTEPGSGTDLASLKTTAVRDGNGYVLNGQKVFTSLAIYADYVWLAARTDPALDKHAGISIFIVDTRAPGVELTPIRTLGDNVCSAMYLSDVRVPAEALVLGENKGWKLITSQLNHERVALMSVGPIARMFTQVRQWARDTQLPDGRRVIEQPWVQGNLARLYSRIELMKLMNWQQAWKIGEKNLNPANASALKVFGSEFYVEGYRLLMEILGASSAIKRGSPEARMQGWLERMYRATLVLTFGGGTNEVQRDIIAMMGLGMPRSPYDAH